MIGFEYGSHVKMTWSFFTSSWSFIISTAPSGTCSRAPMAELRSAELRMMISPS
jgi:hypothetical protein